MTGEVMAFVDRLITKNLWGHRA